MKQIDDKAYAEGFKLFRKGATLRSIVEPMVAHSNGPRTEEDFKKPPEEIAAKECAMMSRCLGFADAFLDAVRGLKR